MNSLKKLLYKLISEKKIDPRHGMLIFKEIELNDHYLDDDIAIIGMAARLPQSDNLEQFWRNLEEEKDCITFPAAQRKRDIESCFPSGKKKQLDFRAGGFLNNVDSFNASFFRISPREADYMEPEQRLLLEVIWQTIEDAGYATGIHSTDTGVYIGHDHVAGFPYRNYTGGIQNPDTLALTGSYPSILSSRISYLLNLKGPSLVIDTACSSGLVALYEACQALHTKVCELAIAGGISLQLWPVRFKSFKMVETENTRVRAFDKRSSGTVWGEGVCTFLLKPLAKARADRDHIHGVIRGIAVNNDGVSSGITAPNASAQEEVILRAWKEAGIDPETISYVETHGTGTVMGDPIEIKALGNAFSRHTKKKQFCGIGSLKPSIGHLVSASGTASLVKVILAMQHKKLPATINFREPNPYINFCASPLYINDRTCDWDSGGNPLRAGISCFGFSGTNCHLVLEEAPPPDEEDTGEQEAGPHLLTLSARDPRVLKMLIEDYHTFFTRNPRVSLADACFTANTGRKHFEHRLAFVFRDRTELLKKLAILQEQGPAAAGASGIRYGVHEIVLRSNRETVSREGERETVSRISEEEKASLRRELTAKFRAHEERDRGKALDIVCNYYVRGSDMDWQGLLYSRQSRNRLSLPHYPFLKERHWYSSAPAPAASTGVPECFLQTIWVPVQAAFLQRQEAAELRVLCWDDESEIGSRLVDLLRDAGAMCKVVRTGEPGTGFNVLEESLFSVDGTQDASSRMLQHLAGEELNTILFLRGIPQQSAPEPGEVPGLEELFYFIRALADTGYRQNLDIILAADSVCRVTGREESINPCYNAVFGMAKVIPQEHRNWHCRSLDFDSSTSAEDIYTEMLNPGGESPVAFREGTRYRELLERLNPEELPEGEPSLGSGGVYLISGGTGGIGLEVASYLVSLQNVTLCLLGRKPLPPKEQWSDPGAYGVPGETIPLLQKLVKLEAGGASVHYYAVDVSRFEELDVVIKEIRKTRGKVKGVVHCAGIPGDGFIIKKNPETMRQVLAPKVSGTINLDRLTAKDKPDFFILCSSIIAVLGSAGQSDYAAGNAFMEGYADYRTLRGLPTMAISWAPWKDTGMAHRTGYNKSEGPFKPLTTDTAMEAFAAVFTGKLRRVIIGEPDHRVLGKLRPFLPLGFGRNLAAEVDDSGEAEKGNYPLVSQENPVRLRGRKNGQYSLLEQELAGMWQRVLGVKEIDIEDSFMKLGGDSISATYLLSEMEKKFGSFIDISDIFTYPTIEQMAAYITRNKTPRQNQALSNEEIMQKLAAGEISIEEAAGLRKQSRDGR